ncbi:unnamed protein product, partial [Closterium sp. NIES-53]
MASPTLLTFDTEGRAVAFDVWLDDLQLFLQCDSKDGLSLFDLTSGASTAPAADADSTALYDAIVARYSSLATAVLSRLMLPYLFPDLAAFATVTDLITHLRTSDTRYRAALPAEFCAQNPPPRYITLYYPVTRLPDTLRSVRDHFLSLCPTTLTVDLLETPSPQQLRKWYAGRQGSGGTGPCTYVLRTGDRTGEQSGVAVFDLDFDAILAAMHAVSISAEGDCYICVPPDPGIEAAALGASESAAPGACKSAALDAGESALSGTASAQVFHTFTLDSGPVLAPYSTVLPCPADPSGSLSGLYLPSFSTNLVSGADLQDAGVDRFTPASQRVTHCTCAQTGRHLATFTRRPGSSLYTLTTESARVAASGQVAASSQVFTAEYRSGPEPARCSCRLLSHQTLLWHHRLGHPSLPRLQGMASHVLVSGLPRSLFPLPPEPAPTCVPCIEGRQRAAPHSSEFPPIEAPMQTLHMDVWGSARVRGQGHERYFLLVVDDYSRYTIVFPLRSKGERRRVSPDLLRAFCRAEGIRQTYTLPASPQQNGIAERRIGMVMDVARTSIIHAAAPHFLWPFAVQYAAHQINLQPRVSLPETSPTLRWTGQVGDASAFRVWGSRAFVRDLSANKLSSRAVPYVFLGFPPDAPGWQFYHPTSRRVLSSQDVTFDDSVPYY